MQNVGQSSVQWLILSIHVFSGERHSSRLWIKTLVACVLLSIAFKCVIDDMIMYYIHSCGFRHVRFGTVMGEFSRLYIQGHKIKAWFTINHTQVFTALKPWQVQTIKSMLLDVDKGLCSCSNLEMNKEYTFDIFPDLWFPVLRHIVSI